jgi:hypothetical protein
MLRPRRRRWAWLLCVVLAAPGFARGADAEPPVRPQVLDRPLESPAPAPAPAPSPSTPLLQTPADPPLGFTGASGILPRETQDDPHFVPVEDRWRLGFPTWDRSEQGKKPTEDSPYTFGHWWDPFNQNVLKGDYPIIGQHTFLDLTATSFATIEGRQVPTATTPFESTQRPFENEFFGRPNQFFYTHDVSLSFDLFHGDSGFKPVDWRVQFTPVFNVNELEVQELGVINPDVRKGTTRSRTFASLEEWFVETKLADLSPDYDFLSLRLGAQPFTSDFRGFLFSDTNRAVRLFGTRLSNREQFNLLYFRQQEKDTNSQLNTFDDRGQDIVIANYFRQDTIWPGYTLELSVHYDHDPKSRHFDKNDFLVRPDPVGTFQEHELNVVYLGWAGDGHINRFNITHQFYWALGRDSFNNLANQPVDINAQFAAVELSYDRDWARFRTSFLYASGDHNINNSHATGFDTILDNPNFAGGEFSYWQRQAIKLFGVNLVQRESLVPDLRSDKADGQANFVNPGLFLFNVGVDFDLTPKWKLINNANLLWFENTNVLKQFVFQSNIDQYIGLDVSTGVEYRPLLSDNIIVKFGVSTLVPGTGFKQLYNQLHDNVDPLVAGFLELNVNY